MRPVPLSPESRQRLLIRATLVAGMLLAGIGLVAVLQGKRGAAPQPPALARTSLRVKVVDTQGRTVRGAEVFVKTKGGAKPAQARWSPQDGVLMLPKRERAHDLRVMARGYRLRDVAGVGSDRTITLERGHRLRVTLRDVPTSGLAKRLRIMLRVRPLAVDADDPDGLDAKALIDLMDNLGGAGPRGISRSFGYPVSVAQAKRGILVPRAGRYHVCWGLFDLEARTWFSLPEGCGRDVDVRGASTDASLVVGVDYLQATIDGLKDGVARAKGTSKQGRSK